MIPFNAEERGHAMAAETSKAMEGWPAELRREFAANGMNGCVGQVLLSESDRVRVWSLSLAPGERIGFHRHVLDYFWTALTDGRARSHYGDGRTIESAYCAGDTRHMHYAEGESMIHDLENIGDTVLAYTTVEFLDSANAPLPIPDSARRVVANAARGNALPAT
jgi:quercetin dioxygenase-like cupin family protein